MGYASCAHACKRTISVFPGTFIIRTFYNSVNAFSSAIIFVIVCASRTADKHLHRVPRTFRARKASWQPAIRWFSKPDFMFLKTLCRPAYIARVCYCLDELRVRLTDQSKMATITGDRANYLVDADFSGKEGPGPRVNNYGSVVGDFF